MTRREYYPEHTPAPPLEIPEAGEYLWDWYQDASSRQRRIWDGACTLISPSEWLAWQTVTGNIVYSWEYDILAAMDVAFCDETNKELGAKREAEMEEARKSQPKPKRGRRR